jgi:hypothetical protein
MRLLQAVHAAVSGFSSVKDEIKSDLLLKLTVQEGSHTAVTKGEREGEERERGEERQIDTEGSLQTEEGLFCSRKSMSMPMHACLT